MNPRYLPAPLIAFVSIMGCGSPPPRPVETKESAPPHPPAIPMPALGKLLVEASARGHLPAVEKLIDAGADVAWGDAEGLTPLHAAAWRGRKSVVSLLLDKGADVNARTKDLVTPLHSAILNEQVPIEVRAKVVELLIFRGADVNAEVASGATPLACAAEKSLLATLIETHGGVRHEPEPTKAEPESEVGSAGEPSGETEGSDLADSVMRRIVGRTFLNSVVRIDALLDESEGSAH